MLPIFSQIKIEKPGKQAVYIQIANQLMSLIRSGTIPSGQRLPSTREMALMLHVHRRTVVQAYDELLSQGWLESHTGKGTFVIQHLPEITPQPISTNTALTTNPAKTAGFRFKEAPHLAREVIKTRAKLHLDDGFPDTRLAPLDEISRAYRSQLLMGNSYQRLGYGDTLGSLWLRQELSSYLNETRAFKTTSENILITRGTVMGLFLASNTLLDPGDHVAVAEMSWASANMNFMQAGARLHVIPVDDFGIDLDFLEQICHRNPLRMLYITSHHQYPTTVVLRADRRLRLLNLAEKYGFIIFEDDYDYDFHYQSKPLLPLAGADPAGMVLYCGSFTKAISPAFRIGYLVGAENVIKHMAQFRRIIDRQGDVMLENSVAELLHNGVIQRHLRKSLRAYKERRDVFCELLKTQLSDYTQFQIPEGGMAVWTRFHESIDLKILSKTAATKDLFFSEGAGIQANPVLSNGTRLGFASSTTSELEQCVEILRDLLARYTT
jgi:GntR family transcriptional regulator/MocR family aminotransferase